MSPFELKTANIVLYTRRTGLTNGMTSSSRTYEEGPVLLVLNIFNVRRPGNLICDEVLGYLRL